jgi:diguanylate cyclase (GGDEF)-like protein
MVSFTDNSRTKEKPGEINYLNSHDPLTGLYNRALFRERTEEDRLRENLPITVIFGDINGLKLTNDVFGHSAGDLLLKTAAELAEKIMQGKGSRRQARRGRVLP